MYSFKYNNQTLRILNKMYSLNLVYKQKTKKLTLPKSIKQQDLLKLVSESFRLKEKLIGLINGKGQLFAVDHLRKPQSKMSEKDLLYLITAQDMNDDNMSFASDHGENRNQFDKIQVTEPKFNDEAKVQIPQKVEGNYLGVIGDLEMFEALCLDDNGTTVVFCFVKEKPKQFPIPYYLYHASKNSAIVYSGRQRVCEFFIESMAEIPKEIIAFVCSFAGEKKAQRAEQLRDRAFVKVKPPKQGKKASPRQKQSFAEEYDQKQESQLLNDFGDEDEQQDRESLGLQEEQPQFMNDEFNLPNNGVVDSQEFDEEEKLNEQAEIKASLLENLLKLKQEEDITELEYYKMKSQLLENVSDFMRKYQMGTRKGFRREVYGQKYGEKKAEGKKMKLKPSQRQQRIVHSSSDSSQLFERPASKLRQREKQRQTQKQRQSNRQYKYQDHYERQCRRQKQSSDLKHREEYRQQKHRETSSPPKPVPFSNERRRSKKYEIPIIVRKYNNVIEKISTSYPLSQEQQQAINLILQLQLKGLVSQKEAAVYKSSILQEDKQVLPLFLDYFDRLIDQLELVSRLKKIKRINSERKERSQHNMRLLIKYAKQNSYELLRNLLLDNNHLVLGALERFRNDKIGEILAKRLEKIAAVYRQKGELENQKIDEVDVTFIDKQP